MGVLGDKQEVGLSSVHCFGDILSTFVCAVDGQRHCLDGQVTAQMV